MSRGQRIPADQVVLKQGDTVYWHNDGHWRGSIDKFVSRDHQWVAVSYDNSEGGDNRAHISNYTVDAPAPPRRTRQNGQLAETANAPRWQQDLQELAERQVHLPPMRRWRNQGLAGALLLAALVSALTGNVVLLVVLVIVLCLMPMAGSRR